MKNECLTRRKISAVGVGPHFESKIANIGGERGARLLSRLRRKRVDGRGWGNGIGKRI